ncbi:glycoside hydrolase family 2 protein [Pseudomonas sp. Hp2]|uniref:glycoside hydrolase family 2 protein n=1 Tax=Pseudomonas sp. Hp2 TaxID=701189 RepID=UPI0015B1A996|nr:glycoside hydrolase family 2 TIM barrel-domain containing protein [Pseudomonas sp. Hp2]
MSLIVALAWGCVHASIAMAAENAGAPGDVPPSRTQVPIDAGWRFLRADAADAAREDFDDGPWAEVTLPHTYNAADGEDGGGYYRGAGWYRRALQVPSLPADRRVWLQFDGAALAADVWVNGRHVGRHEGGYARFRFDITPQLKVGANLIAVRTDNAASLPIAPLGGDFTVFGGLYRGVSIVEVPALHIDLADHGGPGVYASTRSLSDDRASLSIRVALRNDEARARRSNVSVTIDDAEGNTVASARRQLRVGAGSTASLDLPLAIARPRLWQGRADPYLYTVTARLDSGDEVRVPLGLRTIRFDPRDGFVLNGKPYPLHGVNLFHPQRPGRGTAVAETDVAADMQAMDELGLTALRLVHYQHPQSVYDYADRHGIAVWTEIPINGVIQDSARFLDNASAQLRELVRQNYHHPSVVLWGIGNEVYATTPDVAAFLRRMNDLAHELDPSRPTAYAHCCQRDDDPKAAITDVIGFNRYFGWYPEQTDTMRAWAERYRSAFPERAFMVSEYGAGGSPLQQQVPPPDRNVPQSGWHPEQAQTRYHVQNWRDLRDQHGLSGAFVWVAFDLASDGRHEGDRPGINDKGLVSYDRSVRKDAYFWYQANWSARPMVHLLDRRLAVRYEDKVDIAAFSNLAEVSLTINGRMFGQTPVVDHVAQWSDVPLVIGTNDIRIAGKTAQGTTVDDRIQLTRMPSPETGISPIPAIRKPVPAAPTGKPPGQ